MKGRASRTAVSLLTVVAALLVGCAGDSPEPATAVVDTLPSGQVVVRNVGTVWGEGDAWRVSEELRIGTLDGDGPDSFGSIASVIADDAGRIWVLENQADEVRVFDETGAHLRTVGRQGEGPGELNGPARMDFSPDGDLWVLDPSNARVTAFDTTGKVVRTTPMGGGFFTSPWRGGFDDRGRYYSYVVSFEPFSVSVGVFDAELNEVGRMPRPDDPVERDSWRMEEGGRVRMVAGVPFQGRLNWILSGTGTVWALLSDEYRLFELDAEGDTVRTILNEPEWLPVSGSDREQAIEALEWFVSQGGEIDPSMIPDEQPAVGWFTLDETGAIWVSRTAAYGELSSAFDVFDPDGVRLGTVELPFGLLPTPEPFFRGGLLYGVTRDDYDVQYVVRARVDRGAP